ncbi:ubiquitin-like domain-containing protein [Cellulomonas sp. PhB143]|uniref:aggregation-promoting factor C-terminal-like domain-containing protein n=1 Tax=Cellulomonas sp. PhB143 TaxID=2485186 RepID=UPI000FA6B306|nr:ubiquitin-like domain-containing protein [Cellulomonas sp. PhB143]ROS78706.1 uncharacterized protein YabE (DUF348 family) [Cellulomonas sp. PhB143]
MSPSSDPRPAGDVSSSGSRRLPTRAEYRAAQAAAERSRQSPRGPRWPVPPTRPVPSGPASGPVRADAPAPVRPVPVRPAAVRPIPTGPGALAPERLAPGVRALRRSGTVPTVARSAVLAGLVGTTTVYGFAHSTVQVDDDGHVRDVSTYAGTVGGVLEAAGVHPDADDVVQPGLDAPVGDGDTVVVRTNRAITVQMDGRTRTVHTTARTVGEYLESLGSRGHGAVTSASRSEALGRAPLAVSTRKTLTVVADGKKHEVTTLAATVGAALKDAGVRLGPSDETSVGLGEDPTQGMVVQVQRATSEARTGSQTLEHTSSEIEDAGLPKGERRVVQSGRDGEAITSYVVHKLDGKEVSRTVLAQQITVPARDEIVHVGTMKIETADVSPGSARAIGQKMAASRGWSGAEWVCLDKLWQKESGWNPHAQNASSGAYGIPQALPGGKMASAGSDWSTNPATQISWGLDYIQGRYGSPCGAWAHSSSNGWY